MTREGSRQALAVHRTQVAAVRQAKELARRQGVALVVHGRDGHVRLRTDYSGERAAALRGIADNILTRHRKTYEALAKV